MNLSHVFAIIKKDFDIEIRQKYTIYGVFLFAVTSAYLLYKTFNKVSGLEWDILLWIILLYAGLNAIVKSFIQEKRETYLYYYSLFGPLEVIVAKLIYNFIFLLFLSCVLIFVFSILLGNPLKDISLFVKCLVLGVLGISSIFTFVSTISGSSNSNATLMSILSLPLVLPIVLLMERITAISMRLIQDSTVGNDLLILGGIDLLVIGMIVAIFPVLWKS